MVLSRRLLGVATPAAIITQERDETGGKREERERGEKKESNAKTIPREEGKRDRVKIKFVLSCKKVHKIRFSDNIACNWGKLLN